MLRDEIVVDEMWIRATHAINFCALTRAERFLRVKAPDAFE
jgi:hypothetical protein